MEQESEIDERNHPPQPQPHPDEQHLNQHHHRHHEQLLLQDINHHLESNGIIQAGNGTGTFTGTGTGTGTGADIALEQSSTENSYQRLDQVELAANVNAQQKYQEEVIQKFIKEDEQENHLRHLDSFQERERVLKRCRGVTISISTSVRANNASTSSTTDANEDEDVDVDIEDMLVDADEDLNPEEDEKSGIHTNVKSKCKTHQVHVIKHVPLHELVQKCDMLFTLATSDRWLPIREHNDNSGTSDDNDDNNEEEYIFSMNQFSKDGVEEFLSMVLVEDTPSGHGSSNTSACSSTRTHAHAHAQIRTPSPKYIIECCYIAHYLQATSILDHIVSILQTSIDAQNCTSLCILADELRIPSLFQSSMKFVLERLEDIQGDKGVWKEIPSSLRNHILTLRNAAHSSLVAGGHGHGSGHGSGSGHTNNESKQVLFSSGDEFLAIFYDTLALHKDRLKEAKQRQEEIIQERKREWNVNVNEHENEYANENANVNTSQSQSFVGRFTRRNVQERDVYGGSVKDAAIKIEKQERRVKTLQAFYNQQKAIFAQDLEQNGDGRYRGSFYL